MSNSPSSSQFKLPTFGSNIGSPGGGFVLPKLGSLSINSGGTTNSSSLSEFAKAQVAPGKKSFAIPKLFPSANRDEPKTEPEKILIDLKFALVTDKEQKKNARVPKTEVKQTAEVFIPQFIDCDMTMSARTKDLTLEDSCERLTLNEARLRFKGHSLGKLSIVGKIIGRRLKAKVPQVRHGYKPKHNINRFTFNTLSPDDKILAHLNKNKK